MSSQPRTLHAKDIMAKKIITISEGKTLQVAHDIMKDRRIRHLPVINAQQEIVGILSEKDLRVGSDWLNVPVEQVMNTPIEFISAASPIRATILRMLERKISSLIVVDAQDEAIGIVTSDDLLFHLAELLKDEKSSGSWFDVLKLQTAGQIAHQLSQAGI